jgi:hypothetical protein
MWRSVEQPTPMSAFGGEADIVRLLRRNLDQSKAFSHIGRVIHINQIPMS